MGCTVSSRSFYFVEYQFQKYRYTDNRRGAPLHYLAYLEEGRCRIVSEQGCIEAGPGEAFYIPMGLPYQSYWYGTDTIRFRSYGFSFFPEAQVRRFCLQKLACEDGILEQILQIPMEGHPDSAALGDLFSVMAKLSEGMLTMEPATDEQLLELAKSFLLLHPNCRVPDIARHCGISESALYALFRKHGDKTPNTLRQEALVHRAVQLLTTTDLSIQEISDSLHFSSAAYFRKILRAHTGKTPSQVRKSAHTV